MGLMLILFWLDLMSNFVWVRPVIVNETFHVPSSFQLFLWQRSIKPDVHQSEWNDSLASRVWGEVTKTPSRQAETFFVPKQQKESQTLTWNKRGEKWCLKQSTSAFLHHWDLRLSCLERNLKGKSLQKVSQFSCMPLPQLDSAML